MVAGDGIDVCIGADNDELRGGVCLEMFQHVNDVEC